MRISDWSSDVCSSDLVADLKPGGQYVAKDMYEAGVVYMVMKTLLSEGLMNCDCMTFTGKTLGTNLAQLTLNPDKKVINDARALNTAPGGAMGSTLSYATDGDIVQSAGMPRTPSPGPA